MALYASSLPTSYMVSNSHLQSVPAGSKTAWLSSHGRCRHHIPYLKMKKVGNCIVSLEYNTTLVSYRSGAGRQFRYKSYIDTYVSNARHSSDGVAERLQHT